ncbi:HAMP domain-containing histidine kinase [bacterium]|nr:HAMP domain-containing histidine kinase [bacterium]
MGRLIANVLTFSRRESGRRQLQWNPVASDEVIEEMVSQFAPSLERHGIVVEHDLDARTRVLLDQGALFQIMANLVSNVEKYGVSGRQLKIKSRVEDGRLCIQLADRGPGIAEVDRERVFESFVRLDGRVDEGASGTGLGLAIARGLAEDLGGSLALVGSDQGASFELNLPVVVAEDLSLSQ